MSRKGSSRNQHIGGIFTITPDRKEKGKKTSLGPDINEGSSVQSTESGGIKIKRKDKKGVSKSFTIKEQTKGKGGHGLNSNNQRKDEV